MKELTLQELKDIELNLLKRFHSFCTENNIRYFLSHGTLLGAVRYQKFIPWDDDVDLLVPREDYDKLVATFEDCEQYRLFSVERNEKYRFPFAKFCDMTTRKEEFNTENGVELGVDIDIFPLDHWDDDLSRAKQEAKQIQKYMSCLNLCKIKSATAPNAFKRIYQFFRMVHARLFGSKFFLDKIAKASCKAHQTGSRYVGAKSWCVYGERGIIPAEAFREAVDVEFEGEHFPAPIGYDVYLRCLYGDYLPEPPKEKQKTHHLFTAYRLTNE